MSIRQSLLALLAEGPAYGATLRSEFERRTGATWPLNVGQVYTTLARLLRDGLVAEVARREDGTVVYELTDAGRRALTRWRASPVQRTEPPRNELAIKVALGVTTPEVDVASIIATQRAESTSSLAHLSELKARIPEHPAANDLAALLVLESVIFATEAEVRWLDHVAELLPGLSLSQLDG